MRKGYVRIVNRYIQRSIIKLSSDTAVARVLFFAWVLHYLRNNLCCSWIYLYCNTNKEISWTQAIPRRRGFQKAQMGSNKSWTICIASSNLGMSNFRIKSSDGVDGIYYLVSNHIKRKESVSWFFYAACIQYFLPPNCTLFPP